MHYLSKVVGTGTEEDPQRPALADYGVVWAADTPTDKTTGKATSDWCLVYVAPEREVLAWLAYEVENLPVAEIPPEKLAEILLNADLKKAAISAAYASLRADTESCVPLPAVDTFMPSGPIQGEWTKHPLADPIVSTASGAKTYSEFIDLIGRMLEPEFDVRRFGVR